VSVAIVAGANGAIGRHLVAELRAAGHQVGGLGHGPNAWEGETPIDFWAPGEIDSASLELITRRLGPADILVNAAGGASVPRSFSAPEADFRRTVSSTVRLLEWLRSASPATRFVCLSSAAVYGTGHAEPIPEDAAPQPVSPYGFHKLMAEQATRSWARNFGVRAVIVRLFSVYGPGLRKQLVYELLQKLAVGPPRLDLAGTGEEARDWLWIADAARLLTETAAVASEAVPVVNGCTGIGRSVADVAALMVRGFGRDTEVRFDGAPRTGDPPRLVGSVARLREIGFRPRVGLEEGLDRLVRAARSAEP